MNDTDKIFYNRLLNNAIDSIDRLGDQFDPIDMSRNVGTVAHEISDSYKELKQVLYDVEHDLELGILMSATNTVKKLKEIQNRFLAA